MTVMHYFLSASSAEIWQHCAFAPSMAAMQPQEDTDASRWGTASHWYAAMVLAGETPGPIAPNGVVLDDEMRECAQVFIDDVTAHRERADPGYRHGSEITLAARRIHETSCGGSPDYFIYDPVTRVLDLWDYKGGHKEVIEYENPQGIIYLSALLDYLDLYDVGVTCRLHIVQPRCYTAAPIRTWTIEASDLRNYINKLHMAAAEATGPNPRVTTGSHCFYCPGRDICNGADRAALAAIEYSGQPVVQDLPPEGIAGRLRMLERAAEAIETQLSGLTERAKTMFKSGTVIPGYGLEPVVGRRTWSKTPAEVRALGLMYGVKLDKPDQFITPAQAKKLAKIDDAVISAYTEAPVTGVKLKGQNIERTLATTTRSK